jgi:hypothetical protein
LRALILQERVDGVLGLLKCGALEEPSMVKLSALYHAGSCSIGLIHNKKTRTRRA